MLTNTYTNEQSEVCHLKYTAFPDHGVPDNTNGFLKLISLAEEESVRLGEKRGTGRRPILVRKHRAHRSPPLPFRTPFATNTLNTILYYHMCLCRLLGRRRTYRHLHCCRRHHRQTQLRLGRRHPRPSSNSGSLITSRSFADHNHHHHHHHYSSSSSS
jgi:hypothetical protein